MRLVYLKITKSIGFWRNAGVDMVVPISLLTLYFCRSVHDLFSSTYTINSFVAMSWRASTVSEYLFQCVDGIRQCHPIKMSFYSTEFDNQIVIPTPIRLGNSMAFIISASITRIGGQSITLCVDKHFSSSKLRLFITFPLTKFYFIFGEQQHTK